MEYVAYVLKGNILTMSNSDDDHVNLNEFCERHAKAAAIDVVTAFNSFKRFKTNEGVKSVSNCYSEFARKFSERFAAHFEHEFVKRQQNGSTGVAGNGYEESSNSENDAEVPFAPIFSSRKPFFRRLSFKSFRKGRNFFKRQGSDDLDISSNDKKKAKLSNIMVQCRRDGLANYLVAENMDGPPKWEKCRLSLTTSAAGGYILVFYSPPKSQKPKCGIFCHLIAEVRETTDLEMPDKESTFVVRATFNAEYIIEATSVNDKNDWVATLKYCIRESRNAIDGPDRLSLVNEEPGMLNSISSRSLGFDDVPDLPPRPVTFRSDQSDQLGMDVDGDYDLDADLSDELREYPWFHGSLVRAEATNLVQHSGEQGHGVFLVRQSETRKGEFVLTFNFHGRAKHLRMLINATRQCCVQHLWFPTIFDALEHFRQCSIPLENGGVGDVKLTEYIIYSHSPAQPSLPSRSNSEGSSFTDHRLPIPLPDDREIIQFNGPVRVKTEYLELRVRAFPQAANESENIQPKSRAVGNAYSFV